MQADYADVERVFRFKKNYLQEKGALTGAPFLFFKYRGLARLSIEKRHRKFIANTYFWNMQRNAKIIARLTALWALSEAGLGGVLHALQSPFTGFFVGGFAIVLVSLIAYFAEDKRKTIFRSLLVVLIIKLAVSPHSPPTSYLAVSFQALMAALIYSNLSLSKWSAMLLGVITLIESALQKLLVLTLIYGKSLWEAINSFSDYIIDRMGFLGNIYFRLQHSFLFTYGCMRCSGY